MEETPSDATNETTQPAGRQTYVPRGGIARAQTGEQPHETQQAPSQQAPADKVVGNLLAIAIETIPERDAVADEESSSALPKPMYHRVVAMAFLAARIIQEHGSGTERLEITECRAGGQKPESKEIELLSGFWRVFEKLQPRLVTHNGRGFILPVLKYRSMRGKLTSKLLHKGDKWNSYQARGAYQFHADMIDIFSDQRASPLPSLADIAKGLNLPIRPPNLPEPAGLLHEGLIENIRAMAEANVVTVFLSYIRWRLFSGAMTLEAHDAAWNSLYDLLSARPNPRPAMAGLLANWQRIPAANTPAQPQG